MLWGVVIGTYSSVFIAVGMLSWFDLKKTADEDDNDTPKPEYERG
jgi:preprotein translocase subunit SecF